MGQELLTGTGAPAAPTPGVDLASEKPLKPEKAGCRKSYSHGLVSIPFVIQIDFMLLCIFTEISLSPKSSAVNLKSSLLT